MDHAITLQAILLNDRLRWRALGPVQSLELPDGWIGAGFIRNAVWDHLHSCPATRPSGDIDVVWFDRSRPDPEVDRKLQAALQAMEPSLDWSPKNQARMHTGNGDKPYASTAEAIRLWPKTATAMAVRRVPGNRCEILAPFGLDDLFALLLRPTPRFMTEQYEIYRKRIEARRWLTTWPSLRMMPGQNPVA